MSNKKYSHSFWKEKLWRQIGEEHKTLKLTWLGKFQCFLLHILMLLSFYYHRSSNN